MSCGSSGQDAEIVDADRRIRAAAASGRIDSRRRSVRGAARHRRSRNSSPVENSARRIRGRTCTRRQTARSQPREIEWYRVASRRAASTAPRRCRVPVAARCACMIGRACSTMLASCALNVLLNHDGVATRRHDGAGEYSHRVVCTRYVGQRRTGSAFALNRQHVRRFAA